MVIHLKITSNYWACNENEFLFEFYQKQNGYEIVTEHWYVDETNGVDYNLKMARMNFENIL
jgi:hypothetical protein